MTTVSAKIPDEMKEELEKEDINVSEVIRNALEEEITKRRREKLRRDVDSLREKIDDGVETDEIVGAVRETRQEN
ncbi:uncharacterized protein Nmag_0893 [Natrialba magadii ATCC 43099]|uniref:Uncharacterized protein n=1 Tax=Natrialba magadii (strain ATCC 43099 / DSM 3394 / CCM 3739 / CIP 104546 / IAM 13178 / JCM 8861 / NBRC 102185 / NCIMB 2190 / MS3) TaxID=547559 RepID=D3T0B9_NATMM|nr:hypothetical protein [Natrialba magadii]ADD04477.1 uncharacterized protein Nmag_0893 [Natrialba magadii ATCC 43099]ELY25872.1 hypothetical protein C500_16979 [Natrialba magadii ATCC 43099]